MIDVLHFSRLPRSARRPAAGSRFVGALFRRCLSAAEHRSADSATQLPAAGAKTGLAADCTGMRHWPSGAARVASPMAPWQA
jgi:hypothetical protein